MRDGEDVRLSPERYRAAAAGLLKLPFYLVAFSASFAAFGFWKTALLAALFAVCGGRRFVSALAFRLVSRLPRPKEDAAERPRMHAKSQGRSRADRVLVIDLDPTEFTRTKV